MIGGSSVVMDFQVRGAFIQLDQLLKATGLCASGGHAHDCFCCERFAATRLPHNSERLSRMQVKANIAEDRRTANRQLQISDLKDGHW